MSSDDQTKQLDTEPTIETILERLSEFRQIAELRFDNLDKQVSELRSDVRKIDQKINLLVQDTFDLRADQALLNKRVDKLEEKAS